MSFEELLKPGYDYAFECLKASNEFPPFLLILDERGEKHVIVSEDGEAEVRSEPTQRAIAVHVDVSGGLNRLVITPFTNDDHNLVLGTPEIIDSSERLIQRD